MEKTKIIATCDLAGVRVGCICINKEKHLAWFTDEMYHRTWLTSQSIGDVVKSCEELNIVVTPLKKYDHGIHVERKQRHAKSYHKRV